MSKKVREGMKRNLFSVTLCVLTLPFVGGFMKTATDTYQYPLGCMFDGYGAEYTFCK